MLRLYDTATREVRELRLRDPGTVGVYVCGPTVYGPPHLGHGRHLIVYDILRRYLEWTGLSVRLVSNITDIDDNIINKALRESTPWTEVVEKYEKLWFDCAAALGVARPTDVPHATDYVDEMVEGGGEREVFGAEGKRHHADFVLWKFSKPDEPSWPSPWGDGRPGWHSECVVMSLDLLGEGFDLHCGGQDLKFPHHENERAQAVALARTFAAHWMHHGWVVDIAGEKMSKSLGNVDDVVDLLEKYDPRAYRMLLLQAHYRGPVAVGAENLEASVKALAGLDAFAARTASASPAEADPDVLARFRERMDDDLDTPGATALLFDTVRRANTAWDAQGSEAASLVAAVREMCTALGLPLASAGDVPADVVARAAELDAARAAKDYARADALRAELQSAGWTVETTKSGTTVRR